MPSKASGKKYELAEMEFHPGVFPGWKEMNASSYDPSGREVLGNLRDYDPAELLLLLSSAGRSGHFEVRASSGVFRLALREGRVGSVTFGEARDEEALALLLRDPQGAFEFSAGAASCGEGRVMSALLLGALRRLPLPALPFDGAARVRNDGVLATLELNEAERRALAEVGAGRKLSELEGEVRAAAARLARLGVLAPRKVRVAQLTVGVWRDGGREAALDSSITETWTQQLGQFCGRLQVRTKEGRVLSLPARPAVRLGAQLLLSPEALVLHGLRVGDAVLVRPES